MRLPVLLTIALSVLALTLEQSAVHGQLFPGIGSGCLGCASGCNNCLPPRFARRMCRRCMRPNCACPPVMAPAPCAPVCPTYTTRMHPRRVVSFEMVPRTICRREAYCETIPVTTYRQVVVTVPQTEYRNVLRHQMVSQQVMVPRRRVSTVWEPRMHRRFAPVCPPVMSPPMPVYTDGCVDHGGSTVFHGGPSFGQISPMHEMAPMPAMQGFHAPLTVPQPPVMSTPSGQPLVPKPSEEPTFRPTVPDDSQSYYSPWQTVPSRGHYFEKTVDGNDYRTLTETPGLAEETSKFVPVPSASTVWQYRR